jgi:hypothetical protein
MMKSMAEAFERTGNPLVTEREQREMQATLVPVRGGRKMAKEKPPFVQKLRPYPPAPTGPDPVAVLKATIRMMDCPERRYLAPKGRENPRPMPVPMNEQLWTAMEAERRRAEMARMAQADKRRRAQEAEARMWRGFELAMVFAGCEELA